MNTFSMMIGISRSSSAGGIYSIIVHHTKMLEREFTLQIYYLS